MSITCNDTLHSLNQYKHLNTLDNSACYIKCESRLSLILVLSPKYSVLLMLIGAVQVDM